MRCAEERACALNRNKQHKAGQRSALAHSKFMKNDQGSFENQIECAKRRRRPEADESLKQEKSIKGNLK
jgi:hypothetical protein